MAVRKRALANWEATELVGQREGALHVVPRGAIPFDWPLVRQQKARGIKHNSRQQHPEQERQERIHRQLNNPFARHPPQNDMV
jgi:hypothetical protein